MFRASVVQPTTLCATPAKIKIGNTDHVPRPPASLQPLWFPCREDTVCCRPAAPRNMHPILNQVVVGWLCASVSTVNVQPASIASFTYISSKSSLSGRRIYLQSRTRPCRLLITTLTSYPKARWLLICARRVAQYIHMRVPNCIQRPPRHLPLPAVAARYAQTRPQYPATQAPHPGNRATRPALFSISVPCKILNPPPMLF